MDADTEHAGIVDRDALKRYTDRIVSLRADRKEINEAMGGVFKEAKDAGFVPEMIRGVVRELEMEDEARDTFFATQAAYRRALGLLADTPLGKAALDRAAEPPDDDEPVSGRAEPMVARPRPLAEQPLHRGRGRPRKADVASKPMFDA